MNERKATQLKIANILLELGMDMDIVETVTALTEEEIKNKHLN